MKRAKKSAVKRRGKPPTDEDIARADKPCEPPVVCATMAPPATPENAARLADSFTGESWFDGFRAVRQLGRELVAQATSRMSYDPDHAIAMANAYVALLAADGRGRA